MKTMQEADLNITEETLAELKQLASTCNLDFAHLPYQDIQYVLILWGLQKYIETYGLQPQFKVTMKHGTRRPTKADSSDSGFGD